MKFAVFMICYNKTEY